MRLEKIEELRQPTALRLLAIWRECRREQADPLEQSLLGNAKVLAECCFAQGKRVFSDGEEVLETLTAREMEALLRRLAGEPAQPILETNPNFDAARFTELEE